ncbi:MAG: hypothetical protein EOM79_03535, partial [Epsilonproteobacteria bacterium]|nr:hypothetical protein [Campylobacterota bacterium]
MRKKAAFALLFTFAFVLTGCMNDVAELYEGHAYDTGVFSENYYSTWNDSLKNSVAPVAKTYEVTAANSFQIEQDSDFAQLWSPDGFADGKAEPYYSYSADKPHEDAGYGYGPSNNLISVDEVFARGFLSRLYDGRIQCDGYYAKSRVQIDGAGYGALFPKEMVNYRYFALSVRGADMSVNNNFFVNVNINLTFYVYNHDIALYVPYLFQMKNLPIKTNYYSQVTIFGFYFAGVMGADVNLLKRASGMSIT